MPIKFICAACNSTVTTPDAMAGKKGRCPTCKSIMQIPASNAPAETPAPKPAAPKPVAAVKPAAPALKALQPAPVQAPALKPLMPAALQPAALQPLQPLTAQPQLVPTLTPLMPVAPAPATNMFDDLGSISTAGGAGFGLPPAKPSGGGYGGSFGGGGFSNPYAASGGVGASGGYSDSPPLWPLLVPGIGILVICVPTLILLLLGLIGGLALVALEDKTINPFAFLRLILGLVGVIMLTMGALSIVQRKNHSMALTGAVLAILTCFLLPLGVWALVVLNQPNYKRQFKD